MFLISHKCYFYEYNVYRKYTMGLMLMQWVAVLTMLQYDERSYNMLRDGIEKIQKPAPVETPNTKLYR